MKMEMGMEMEMRTIPRKILKAKVLFMLAAPYREPNLVDEVSNIC